MVSTPKAPDPYATAAAQSAMNQQTATYQAGLNMVNQVTPDYTLTYSGKNNGQPGSATATQSLSPANQAIYDTDQITKQNIANIGAQQSAKIGSLLNSPIDMNSASETKYEQLAKSRLDPQWAQKRQGYESDLINRGIRPGSEAYNTMMNQFGQQENDAYNSLYVAGKGMFNQEALAERNQPINEISALLSGTQVSQPNFINTPQTQVANTDLMGAVYNSANMKAQQQNAMLGGLFGLAGAGLTAGIKYSDRRLKTGIKRVGRLDNGLGVYVYRYKGSDTPEIGLLAQEVEAVKPGAVHEVGGFKAVDYAKAVEG